MTDLLTEATKIVSQWRAAPVQARTRQAAVRSMEKLARLLLPSDPLRSNPLTGERNTADSILDDPEFKAYAARVVGELVPKIDGSAMSVSLVPKGDTDVKFAIELGLSIMLDKPIIAIIDRATPMPRRLELVAEEIVRVDMDDLGASEADIMAAVHRVGGDDDVEWVADDG